MIAMKNGRSSTRQRVELLTIETTKRFMSVIFWCLFYRKSPEHMMKHSDAFPKFSNALASNGGLKRFKSIMSSISIVKEHHGMTWEAYFSSNQDINKLERLISEHCSGVVYKQ